MEPKTRNFQVVEGDSFTASVTLRDKATGNPIVLTGAAVKMQLRTSYDAILPSLEFAVGDGITVDGANGIISLNKAIDIAAGEYVYDLQVTFSGPVVRTYLRGRFKVLEGVTP